MHPRYATKQQTSVTISIPDGEDLAGIRDFIQNQVRAWGGKTAEGKIAILDPNRGFLDGGNFTRAGDVGQVKMVAALYVKDGAARVAFLDDKDEDEDERIRRALGTYWLIIEGHAEVPS